MAASRACSQEKNTRTCNCTYEPCSRKGLCCECISYHWAGRREMPACFFPDNAERTYDRSLSHFLAVWEKERG